MRGWDISLYIYFFFVSQSYGSLRFHGLFHLLVYVYGWPSYLELITVDGFIFVCTNCRGFNKNDKFVGFKIRGLSIFLHYLYRKFPFRWYWNSWIGPSTKTMKIGKPAPTVFWPQLVLYLHVGRNIFFTVVKIKHWPQLLRIIKFYWKWIVSLGLNHFNRDLKHVLVGQIPPQQQCPGHGKQLREVSPSKLPVKRNSRKKLLCVNYVVYILAKIS